MDGFRERLGGRYDRSGMRGSGYERMPSDDRFESDRYERSPRRGAPEISAEAISEAVNEAVTKANQEQLDVIADFFDEAKADRMESERAIIDALSHSIAAASILAKVSRDRLMNEMAKKYPEYGFDKHKGYGTKLHREKILEHGICEIHRPSFLKKLLGENDDKIQ